MDLCCFSDTHGRHEDLDLTKYPADTLIFSGDWTVGHDLGFSETEAFLQWLNSQPYKNKIFIAGNHERQIEADPIGFHKILMKYPDLHYLKDSEVTIDGLKFYGSPYSNEFGNWAFMEDDLELSKIWSMIPHDTDILITHGPAYKCNDKVANSYDRDPYVGSKSLREKKLSIQDNLQVHISGHIHEAYNLEFGNTCININASILNEEYRLINEPIIITGIQ